MPEAAEATSEKDHEWGTLAQDAADNGCLHVVLIRYIAKVGDAADSDNELNDTNRALLNVGIQRLENFMRAAPDLLEDLKTRVQATSPSLSANAPGTEV